jgi:hypothetical protein
MKKAITFRFRIKKDAKGLTNAAISVNSDQGKYNLNLKNLNEDTISSIRKHLEEETATSIKVHKKNLENFVKTSIYKTEKLQDREETFGEKGFHHEKVEEVKQEVVEEVSKLVQESRNIITIGKYKFAQFGHNVYFSEILSLAVPPVLLEMMKQSDEYKLDCLINYFRLLALNPDPNIVEKITDYVVRGQFKISNLGFLVGYKKVTSRSNTSQSYIKESGDHFYNILESNKTIEYSDLIDKCEFTDSHTKRMTIKNGHLITMARKDCDNNPNNGCSTGLHIGTYSYSSSFSGNVLLLCLFSPSDIANLPLAEPNKLRASAYIPLGILEGDDFQTSVEKNDFRIHPDIIFEAKRNLETFFDNNKDLKNQYTDFISDIDTHISFIEAREILNKTANTVLSFVKVSEADLVKVTEVPKLVKSKYEHLGSSEVPSVVTEDEDLEDEELDEDEDYDDYNDEKMYEDQDSDESEDEEIDSELEEFKQSSINRLTRMRWKLEKYCVISTDKGYELIAKEKLGDNNYICDLV